MKKTLFALPLLLSPIPSLADSVYIGVKPSILVVSSDYDVVFPGLISLSVIAPVSQFLHFEARGGIGTWSSQDGAGISWDVDSVVGGYARPSLEVDSETETYLYGIFGYSMGSFTASYQGDSASGEDSGFSYGAGILTTPAGNNGVGTTVEWMRVIDQTDYSINAFTIGLHAGF